jgi:hypothetical protein
MTSAISAQKEIDEQAALGIGLKEKAEEFIATGSETLPGVEGLTELTRFTKVSST